MEIFFKLLHISTGYDYIFYLFKPCFSILNKLTPERFDKLCLELLNVGIDSEPTLRGLIILVSRLYRYAYVVLCCISMCCI